VALAGLNHKLGWRGTTNTLLNFGEGKYPVDGKAGAVGYLVGSPGKGLHCMFHMMNEARIGVGTAATMLGMAGYYASLDYAKSRPQGRLVKKPEAARAARSPRTPRARRSASSNTPTCAACCSRKRRTAKARWRWSCTAPGWSTTQKTGDAKPPTMPRLLLEVLTPIAKSWPSEWCLEANSLAIQVHGGYGYTRDFPVEQYWRDNRLNMIHEGTHGIQAADLLGRKVLMEKGRGLQLLAGRITETIGRTAKVPALAAHAKALGAALQRIGSATEAAWSTGDPADALANAVPYMQAFGHTVLAWLWLDVARRALEIDADKARAVTAGKIGATDYFFHYELPKIGAWLNVVESRDPTCTALPEDAF
jgi:hypothetical protein